MTTRHLGDALTAVELGYEFLPKGPAAPQADQGQPEVPQAPHVGTGSGPGAVARTSSRATP